MTPTEVRLACLANGHLPIPVNGKIPVFTFWQNCQPTETIITGWAHNYPDAANTSILTRPTPVLDLDILIQEAADDAEALVVERLDGQHILKRFGQPPKRAIPFQTAKPFKKIGVTLIPPNAPPNADLDPDWWEKVEFLCDGQQCVVDGVHPDTRKPYSWHGGTFLNTRRDDLPAVDAAAAQQLVDDIVELLISKHGYRRKEEKKPRGTQTDNGHADWGSFLDNLIDHNSDAAFAMSLIASGMHDGAAVNFLRKLIERLEGEDPERKRRRLDEIPGMVSSARRKINEAFDAPPGGGEAGQKQLQLWWHGDKNPDLNRAWLVEDLLPETGTALISGQWGTYKTFVALDLVLSLMAGATFAGHGVNRRCGVLFVAVEGAFEIPLRLQGALETKFPDIDPTKRLPFAMASECPRLLDRSALETLENTARAAADHMRTVYGVELGAIMIDTMSAAARFDDEGDNAEGQRAMDVLTQLARRLAPCIVIAVDHFGKAVEVGTRGASAKEASADAVLAVLADRELSGKVKNPRMAIRKVRGAPSGNEVPFSTQVVDAEDGQTTLVIDWQAERSGAPPKEVWSPTLRVFRDALVAALDGGGTRRQMFSDDPDNPTVRAVDREAVRTQFIRRYAVEGDTEEKRQANLRQAFKRGLNYARGKNLIGIEVEGKTTWIWFTNPAEIEA